MNKKEISINTDGVHLKHCFQGEYKYGCKYGNDNCPAKPKQDTLEDAAEKYERTFGLDSQGTESVDFIEGAKWQQERSYTEEEVFNIITQMDIETGVGDNCGPTVRKRWFEKYKK